MEKTNLPKANTVLILGILSIITCCCYGIFGLVLGIIALVLADRASKAYRENPETYPDYNNITIGKVLAIIGVILSAIYMIFCIYLLSLGEQGMKDFMQNLQDKVEYQQQNQ